MEGPGPGGGARGPAGAGRTGSGCGPSTKPTTRDTATGAAHHAGPSPHQRHHRRRPQTHGNSSHGGRALGSAVLWMRGGVSTRVRPAPRGALVLWAADSHLEERGARLDDWGAEQNPAGTSKRTPCTSFRPLGTSQEVTWLPGSVTWTATAWKQNGRNSSISAARELAFFSLFN